jgi:hypothetical protein
MQKTTQNDFAVHDFAYFFRQNEQNFRKQFCLCCSTSVSQRHRIRSTAKGLTQKIAVSCVLERKF